MCTNRYKPPQEDCRDAVVSGGFCRIIALLAIYGIIERRTEANILRTSLEFGRFSKIAAKLKLLPGVDPGFLVFYEKVEKGIAFAYG